MVGGLSPQFGPQLSITPDLHFIPMGFRRKAGGFPESPGKLVGWADFSLPLRLEPALEMLAMPPTKRPGLGRGPTIPFEIVTMVVGVCGD